MSSTPQSKEKMLVGDLRRALKDLPSKMVVELHVMDPDTTLKMAGYLDFHAPKDEVLRLYVDSEYLGGTS